MPASTETISPPALEPAEMLAGLRRSAAGLQAKLDGLIEILSSNTLMPTDDFATRLQWESWQNERRQLEEELMKVKKAESAILARWTPELIQD
jgi:hypothetical protein